MKKEIIIFALLSFINVCAFGQSSKKSSQQPVVATKQTVVTPALSLANVNETVIDTREQQIRQNGQAQLAVEPKGSQVNIPAQTSSESQQINVKKIPTKK